MAGFGFDTLALLAVIGMAGPLLASLPRWGIPVVIGELAAGVVVGKTGLGIIDAGNPTLTLLADIGFALVMFVVGTHVPVRDTTLRSAIPSALMRAVLVGAVAAGLATGIAVAFHTGHAALYAVLMASSSAALALPIIDSLRLDGPQVLSVTAQIAIADAACIVLLPLVIDPHRAPRAALGALAVAGCAVVLFLILRALDRAGYRQRLHDYSEEATVRAGAAGQPDHPVRAGGAGRSHPRVDHARRVRARTGRLGDRRTATADAPAVRDQRGFLRPAVLRVAGRLAAGA